jgi:hypothetical protein
MSLPDLEEAAIELVTEFGGAGTYTSFTNGTYNTSTAKGSDTLVTQPVTAVLLDLTLQSNGMSLKYGTTIIAGDKEAYMLPPANLVKITPGRDYLTFGGVRYTVVTFKEINPTGNLPYVYFLYLRR